MRRQNRYAQEVAAFADAAEARKVLWDKWCDLDQARDRYWATVKAAYPVGAEISWVRNERLQHGRVLQQSYSDRLQVRNSRTLGVMWITGSDALAAEEFAR